MSVKQSREERILKLEEEVRRLQRLLEVSLRESFINSTDRIFPAKTSAGAGGSYPSSPANVLPIIFQDVSVDTRTIGNQTVTRRDRSEESTRNVYSDEYLADETEIFVVEHMGHLLALKGGGAKVNIIEGRAKGTITAGTTGPIDNLSVVVGAYGTIADAAQEQTVLNPTTAFTIDDNAWVIAIQRADNSWYVINAECLGDPAFGVVVAPESVTVTNGDIQLAKAPELIFNVNSDDGSSLLEGLHYTVNYAQKKLSLVQSTYPGSGPPLYVGGYVEGTLMRVAYMSKE